MAEKEKREQLKIDFEEVQEKKGKTNEMETVSFLC